MNELSIPNKVSSVQTPPDVEARRLARSPAESLLVQAPAGSGKTTLLVERFLQLLAHVKQPEEILAITFTRKAANEMRRRVLTALGEGAGSIALAALKRNKNQRWELLENSQRLKIQTIDSFAYSLVQRLPCASRLGLDYQTLDMADSCYEEAIRRVLQGVVSPLTLNADVIKFLALFDNNYTDAFLLLKRMLETQGSMDGDHSGGHTNRDRRQPIRTVGRGLGRFTPIIGRNPDNLVYVPTSNCYPRQDSRYLRVCGAESRDGVRSTVDFRRRSFCCEVFLDIA